MPQIFRIGTYTVYFWSNEGVPLEPIHVHIAEGRASANGTTAPAPSAIWESTAGAGKNVFPCPSGVLRSYIVVKIPIILNIPMPLFPSP